MAETKQLTNSLLVIPASEDNPIKIKATEPGVELNGFGLEVGDEVEVTSNAAVSGFGSIVVTDPSEKPKAAPKKKAPAKKPAAKKSAPKKAAKKRSKK